MATASDNDDDDDYAWLGDEDVLPAGTSEAPRMHDDIPITGYNRGEPVPDLRRLPQERWREVLKPLSPFNRRRAVASAATPADAAAALALVGLLMLEDPPPGSLPPATPMPGGLPAPRRGSSRQVNFRLGPEGHARLVEAARFYGKRPSTFARLLTVRGVDAALYEKRRAG